MKNQTINVKIEDLAQLKQDIALIKQFLFSEGELTEWAKNELVEARKTPDEEYISMDEIEKEFL